jgi:hypothetical protein
MEGHGFSRAVEHANDLGFSSWGMVLSSNSLKAVPQRLKPIHTTGLFGTAEAVPFLLKDAAFGNVEIC